MKVYVNQENISKKEVNTLIFLFGLNKSQYKAVFNAIQNNMSVIEGPPVTALDFIIAKLVNAENTKLEKQPKRQKSNWKNSQNAKNPIGKTDKMPKIQFCLVFLKIFSL